MALLPAGTDHWLIPYVGAGVYIGEVQSYRHKFTTTSDNCDADPDNCTTDTTDHFIDSSSANFATVGYYALAGLQVPVSDHLAVEVEGRYTEAHVNLGGDFKGGNSDLDLSGAQVTLGMAIRF